MTETEFNQLADKALSDLETALNQVDADIDFAFIAAGVLEIECANGSKIIVNRHAASQEIWIAARSGGFHYRWDGQCWRDTRSQVECFAALAVLLSEQTEQSIVLSA